MRGAGRNRHQRQEPAGRGGAKGRSDRGRSDAGSGRRDRSGGGSGGTGRSEGKFAGRERHGGPAGAGRSSGAARTGGAGREGRGPAMGAAAGALGAGRGRTPSAGRAVPRAEALKPGRRKGEWMEFRLPEALAGAPIQKAMAHTPLAPKLVSKLMQTKGIAVQGSILRLRLFPEEQRDFPADWMELNVLYEDDFTLVVNKPAGYEVHPSEKGQRRTLAHAVAAYYETTNQDVRIRHIHRIDKETTGPVLYAKNEFAHYQYDKEMREKKIERVYLALAEGVLPQDKGTIDKPIGQDRHHSTRRRVSETGDPAVTHYEVVERFADHTLVRLRLETGRTHQIRVHLSAIGHPLAGDGLYGGKRGLISRQALHGERLIWHHPWTGEKLSARAPLPDDFVAALDKLRGRE
ncbi:RluA family pseudouridine synthase [Cohnella xylanilytica]|nr:RluA family pseudouridine synthase [Cohnella xylanilytica]